jgi:hypothetical protein
VRAADVAALAGHTRQAAVTTDLPGAAVFGRPIGTRENDQLGLAESGTSTGAANRNEGLVGGREENAAAAKAVPSFSPRTADLITARHP